MTRFPGFVGPSYQLQSVNLECQRTANMFLQKDEIGTGKDGSNLLINVPGLKPWGTVGTGPIRCTYTASNGTLYVVSGTGFYSVNSLGAGTLIANLFTSTGRVSMVDNGIYLMIVDGSPSGYVYTFIGGAFSTALSGFQGGNTIVFADGYFVANYINSYQAQVSNIADPFNWLSINGGSLIVLQSNTNFVKCVIEQQRMLWCFGAQAIDIYYDSGDSTNPWQRFQPGFIHYGAVSPFSVQRVNNTLFWVGSGDSGLGNVFKANGISAQRISTTAVELAIQTYGDLSGTTAYIYQQDGHAFYCVNFPGANTTWVYDDGMSAWHERTSMVNGVQARHRAECAASAYSLQIVGDYLTGALYTYDPFTYTDNGAAVPRIRTLPHVSASQVRMFHKRLTLDMETGVGLDGTGQGTSPTVMLSWSDDGGHSWVPERTGQCGNIGAFRYRIYWDRLGESRNRVYSFKVTDPIKVAWLGADLNVTPGRS